MRIDRKELFADLYAAPVEASVEELISQYGLDGPECWRPYGGNTGNFGVIENQQASPIPALIEKITNGIDAILMRRCFELGIDPRGPEAPASIEEAVGRFFPDHKYWYMPRSRSEQAKDLQVLADGPRGETSLVVYDGGEGQAPDDFERTFLSLNQNNKTSIQFVQGKYNMGGTGALVFCGSRRFQLIGSKRFDGGAPFGFTLVRRHRLRRHEEKMKATWYEYLVLDASIPKFEVDTLDLGLFGRQFSTGSVIKLYSYDLPPGARSVISRDLHQSVNEYLFKPALPVYTIDTARRYPRDRALQRSLYGLQNRLDEDSEYIERSFSEELTDEDMGALRIKCYVFKARTAERTARETLSTIRREFFKNDMCVLFSMNGQVHGSYTSEFATRALKFHLLKNHLLIHVDCTSARQEFRNELFMASRDRLKKGTEASRLRQELSTLLSTGRLKDIHSARKASVAVDDEDAEELIRKVARDLPIGGELARLLRQTFDLKDRQRGGKEHQKRQNVDKKQANGPAFSGRRFPTFFRMKKSSQSGKGIPIAGVPLGGTKTIQFGTDVEDQYFDRADEPGELSIAVLSPLDHGGSGPHPVQPHYRVMNVVKSSPESGTIRLRISPTREARVGDTVRIRASLSSPGEELREVFEVKVSDRKKAPSKQKRDEGRDLRLALPKLVRTYRQPDESTQSPTQSWDQVEGSGVGSMDHDVVVLLLQDGDKLDTVFVNMDSRTLLAERGRAATTEARQIVEKRYISAVYFHALFLYTITKSRRYELSQKGSDEEPGQRDIAEYIADLFSHYYAQFLLSFETKELLAALDA